MLLCSLIIFETIKNPRTIVKSISILFTFDQVDDDEGVELARLQAGLQKLLRADADVEDIIDNVLAAGEGNAAAAANDDFVFKKPVGMAPRAKKQKAAQGWVH